MRLSFLCCVVFLLPRGQVAFFFFFCHFPSEPANEARERAINTCFASPASQVRMGAAGCVMCTHDDHFYSSERSRMKLGRPTENLEAQFVEPPFLDSRTPNFHTPRSTIKKPLFGSCIPRFRGTPARGLGCKLPVGIAKAHFRSICCTQVPRLRRAGDLSVHLPSTLLDLSPVSF